MYRAMTEPSASQAKIYADYTQDELDKAYSQPVWAPNIREVLARQTEQSAALRATLPPLTYQYGPSGDETLDVFGSGQPGRKIHVHIHGGAWRALTKEDVSFLAPVFVDAGHIFIALNFAVIPQVTLPEMVEQAGRAIAWIHANAATFGGDPDDIHLSGHSAGAHMAGVLLTHDWQTTHGLPADVLKSGTLLSGLYDLEPVMLSARSSYVTINAGERHALSALHHIERINAPLALFHGDKESPEFKRQTASFAAAVQQSNRHVTIQEIPDCNHFEIMDVFADSASPISQAALRSMAGVR